jgi:glycosyltransferase involved in cell wall biosynthesis
MKKVSWQSRSAVVWEAVKSGSLPDSSNGGNSYDFHAFMALKQKFNIDIDDAAVKRKEDSFPSYWWRMANHSANGDIIISEPSPIVFGKRNKKSKSVAMIHHIDDDLAQSSIQHRWFFSRLKRRLPDMDLVITVSSHWENYLRNIGCTRIKKIYNSFNPADYKLNESEVDAFRNKFDFKKDKPLIYIGNAHMQKGVQEVFAALKEKNVHLVMTGKKNHVPHLPVKFLSLTRHDYIALLNASDIVITFSKMTEGWNRIAHEAMLCGTPVIGSGSGGMKELLEGGGQMVVPQAENLAGSVDRILANRDQYARTGLEYVRQFDLQYFQNEWINTIHDLL